MTDNVIQLFPPRSDKFEELHQSIWFGKFGAAAMEAKNGTAEDRGNVCFAAVLALASAISVMTNGNREHAAMVTDVCTDALRQAAEERGEFFHAANSIFDEVSHP